MTTSDLPGRTFGVKAEATSSPYMAPAAIRTWPKMSASGALVGNAASSAPATSANVTTPHLRAPLEGPPPGPMDLRKSAPGRQLLRHPLPRAG